MKKYLLSLFVALGLISLASANTFNVDVANYAFTPADIVCNVGDTVVWTLSSGMHTTTSTSVPSGAAAWDYTFSGVGDTYSYVVALPGSYTYECTIHTSMQGTITASYAFPYVENFDYAAGELLIDHGWQLSGSSVVNPLTVTSPGLTFPGYPYVSGNAATLTTSGEDLYVNFANPGPSSGDVYMAFMLDVTAAQTGDYFIALSAASAQTNYYDRIHLKSSGAGYLIGVSKSNEVSGGAVYGTTELTFDQTYLIVTKYVFNPDSANDDAISIFVLTSDIPAIEPSNPEIDSYVNTTKTDISDISTVTLRQGNSSNAASLVIDGIRIGTTWNDVVPVELTSFTASVSNNSVTLNWKTATETNNRGFSVQRKTNGSAWTNVSFVTGNGTTTQPHEYSYVDNNLETGRYSYRLKQVDMDGSYEYSNVAEASVDAPAKFNLAQNYPNPFNPTTKIDFTVPSNSNVKLTVYNVLGQQIVVLVNGFLKSGSHSVDFNAVGLNSGLYFYKLESNGVSLVKKMMLVK